MAAPIGCSERVSSEAASRSTSARSGAVHRQHVDDVQPAVRQRPGLVERDAADRRQLLEVRAALDEHALPRRRGQRRHDRHRRRDDERARARDHQQHERSINPRRPAGTAKEQGGASAIDDRERQHDRGVDAREAIDERLARRALRLRALDQVDDPRQRGVAAAAASRARRARRGR